MKTTISDKIFNIINTALMIIIILLMLYPVYFTIVASVSDPYSVAKGEINFFVKGFSIEAYKNVFSNHKIWTGYRNTILYSGLGTIMSLGLTIPAAYALSKKKLPGRAGISIYFLFTMYFSGGLIPTYILVDSLNMVNKPITLIVLGGISVYNLIVTRVFYQTSIPDAVYESACIDGASEFRQFVSIALPLSSAIIAVMTLFYGVARWNDYYTALIYIYNADYMPLQMVLRSILIQNQTALSSIDTTTLGEISDEFLAEKARQAYIAEAMKYALIFIASAPLLIAYPFVQKYFVKGIMMGSIKG
jgi:putative aldouronate transport system permease protein